MKFFSENIDGSELEAGGKVGDLLRGELGMEFVGRSGDREIQLFLDGAKNGSLETTERKIKLVDFRDGEVIFMRIASLGGSGNGGAAWVGKTENFGDFIETFANGVIAGSANNFEIVVTLHIYNLGVTARNDGSEEGEFGLVAAEPVGVNVRFEVMSWVERFVVENSKSAGGKRASKERTDEAWGMSNGDSIEIVEGELGVLEGFI